MKCLVVARPFLWVWVLRRKKKLHKKWFAKWILRAVRCLWQCSIPAWIDQFCTQAVRNQSEKDPRSNDPCTFNLSGLPCWSETNPVEARTSVRLYKSTLSHLELLFQWLQLRCNSHASNQGNGYYTGAWEAVQSFYKRRGLRPFSLALKNSEKSNHLHSDWSKSMCNQATRCHCGLNLTHLSSPTSPSNHPWPWAP